MQPICPTCARSGPCSRINCNSDTISRGRRSISRPASRSVAASRDRHLASPQTAAGSPSGIAVEQGHKYEITATGDVTLAKLPKPWISQPQGISIVYSEGHPIGTLLATVRREPPANGSEETMLKEIVVGRNATFVAATSGTLYFRINDRWGSLADNKGRYRVVVRELAGKSP